MFTKLTELMDHMLEMGIPGTGIVVKQHGKEIYRYVYEEYMSRPFVAGRDLVEAGLEPGADFSEILSYAHKLRLAGIEKKSALKQTLAYAKKLRK